MRKTASGALGFGVGNARLGQYMHDRKWAVPTSPGGSNRVRFDDLIDEHLAGRPVELGFGNSTLDQKSATRGNRPWARDA